MDSYCKNVSSVGLNWPFLMIVQTQLTFPIYGWTIHFNQLWLSQTSGLRKSKLNNWMKLHYCSYSKTIESHWKDSRCFTNYKTKTKVKENTPKVLQKELLAVYSCNTVMTNSAAPNMQAQSRRAQWHRRKRTQTTSHTLQQLSSTVPSPADSVVESRVWLYI